MTIAAAEPEVHLSMNPEPSAPFPRSHLMFPLEASAAALMVVIVVLLLMSVTWRYGLNKPLVWVDEVVSYAFLWMSMIGAAIAMHRNEHLRLTLFLDMMPKKLREWMQAFALIAVAAFLAALLEPTFEFTRDEWVVPNPGLGISNAWRVAAMPFGVAAMLAVLGVYATRTVAKFKLAITTAGVLAATAACIWLKPQFMELGLLNMLFFMVLLVVVCLVSGVPIAFCFGVGVMTYLAFSTNVPIVTIVGRMDEGIGNFILVSVPIFVLLGCILDATGMGKAIVDFLASLIGHVKAGMSYVLLGSLFIVSGISGSKVSDMATVAPALFPEMTRRGNKRSEMVALLATGAAMADTVPPSIVLIVIGSVAGVSIAGLFNAGIVVAMVLLAALLVLARWKARNEKTEGGFHGSAKLISRLLLVAAPALALPFLIRGAVSEGVATATEVSTIAVLYAAVAGHLLYGGISRRKFYEMLVETAALSGSILLILGTATAMAWAITQSGLVQGLSVFLTTLPGGWVAFMAVTIVVFLILGCLLEGLPAVLLLAPIMFPIAKKLGINDVQYAMVVVCAMNVGLMMPPVGIGFYVACRIGDAKPDEVMKAIWPYLAALLVGVAVIAAVPSISTFFLSKP